ncbi:EscU/YscU/HrcU family type III secretion system export apparatus switch protein [Bacillus tianshenii]|uniref:EscU/YscU/HrcU family type III secretion system export apparatus switch protein n=1 Tax=Sutcliffiella tianshenii TaxID=1463404 RepID=UPI001CD4E325|nr:EscU/YscU/HrcU family type III secretion system export apparatus switch protein [Bacillus tianshenii]MCA1321384.1 EscU/YscU/HrcU family type III secretion system export apparatus switch protein [Bacillus tianshenii]
MSNSQSRASMERKKAVALKYDKAKHTAPIVSAKGRGIVADNIIQEALKHNIPIQEDSALIEMLLEIELNESIPEELYEIIAEVLSFIYQLHNEKKG